jgi:hypothetical protein
MFAVRRQRLDQLGFIWDTYGIVDWEEGFNHLKRYKDRVGHCRVPRTHKEDGYNLGTWVTNQRFYKEQLLSERRCRLDDLGFVWDIREAKWEEGFRHLKRYKDRVGHCRVPHMYTEDGINLGAWVANQRSRKGQLSKERRCRLDELGFEWDIFEADWEEGFRYLKHYKERVGDCRVPRSHKEDGYNLGRWVGKQRSYKRRLSSERRRRLDELGFVWTTQ